jgi:glycosyltransferase involved in cell wall biosynthesis
LTIGRIICNSRFTANVIGRKLPASKINIIYPPLINHVHTKPAKRHLILSVGRFTKSLHQKRQDILITAFRQMVDAGLSGWHLGLVGNTNENNNLLAQYRNLAKGYPIDFYVNSSQETLHRLYQQASLFWHATGYGVDETKLPELVEHFGLATVEAMSYGCVPVVINKGGQKEIVDHQHNGFLFNDIQELISFSNRLIGDHELFNQMAQKARDSVSGYDFENFRAQILKII